MAVSINRMVILGNLARDAESRSFANGGRVVNLRVATSERWKDKNTGEWKERAEYHSVAIFADKLGEKAEALRKGSRVYVEGQLQTRKWTDNSGVDKYSTEIVLQGPASVLEVCDGKPSEGRSEGGWGSDGGGASRKPNPFDAGDIDDDVPF